MALRKNLELINNFGDISVFKDSIIKVHRIVGDKDNIQAEIRFYKNNGDLLEYEYIYFKPSLDNNFIKQAYEYLKTLEEFKDAEDC